MTAAAQQPMTAEERRQLEELYRAQISAVRALARLLGYPCPIVRRDERTRPESHHIDDCAILTFDS